MNHLDLLTQIERNRWCIIPPNQETADWTVYARFDGEFGYQDEIGSGATLTDAIEMALAVLEDTQDVH